MSELDEIDDLIASACELIRQSKFAQAEKELKKAVSVYVNSSGDLELASETFAYLLYLLATNYVHWDKKDKAEELYFRAIETLEKCPEPTYKLLSQTLNDLAELYLSASKLAQAQPLLDRARLICEEWLDGTEPECRRVLENLALVSYKLGNFREAKLIGEKLLAAQEASLGSRHADVAETLELLATIHQTQRKFDKSELQYKRSLSIVESIYGQQSDNAARVLRKLASLHCDKQDHTLAKPLLKKALAVRKSLRRPQDEEFASAYLQLAEVYYVECNYQAAELYYKKALAIRKRLIGPHTLETADVMGGIGKLYCAVKRFKEAETSFNGALQIQIELLGPYNREVSNTLTRLAGVYMSQGRFNEANLVREQATSCQVQHMQLTVDDQDPYDRAVLYHSQGEYKEAEDFYHKALAKVERNLGTDHFRLAEILTKLAELHRALGRMDKAEMLLQQSLKTFQRMQHRAALTSYAALADLYVCQQRYIEAEELYLAALTLIDNAVGVRQSDQSAIMGGYEKMLSLCGRKQEASKIRSKLRNIMKRTRDFQSIIQKSVKPS